MAKNEFVNSEPTAIRRCCGFSGLTLEMFSSRPQLSKHQLNKLEPQPMVLVGGTNRRSAGWSQAFITIMFRGGIGIGAWILGALLKLSTVRLSRMFLTRCREFTCQIVSY
ncbi:hypothetical protein BDW69DRAFT_171038 [Aspergillus filifer]